MTEENLVPIDGPLLGKTVLILSGFYSGEYHEVVGDMHPHVPLIGIQPKGITSPMAYADDEYEVVEDA